MTEYLGYQQSWLEGKHAIHTAKEISHQPKLWQQLHGRLKIHANILKAYLSPILENPQARVILTGAGTSAFAGDALAPYLNQQVSCRVEAIATTDIVACPELYLDKAVPTLLVSFARSGNSPESVAAVSVANQLVEQCFHLVLTCNPNGELAHYATGKENAYCLLMPDGSNDQSFAMTSSFSCMTLAALALIAPATERGLTHAIANVCEVTKQKMAQWQPVIKTLAAEEYDRLVYLGAGGFQGLAREAALKSLELTAGRVMTAFDTPLGFRHGPKFIINKNALVVQFLSQQDYTRRYDFDLLNEIKNDQQVRKVIALSAQQEASQDEIFSLGLDGLGDVWSFFPMIVFAQMLGFEKSLQLGLSPDNPCPTGEVNRVVRGVTIHPYAVQ